jgi:hypothetical protein
VSRWWQEAKPSGGKKQSYKVTTPVNGSLKSVPKVKSENSHILLKSRNPRKHGHFKEFGGK